MKSVNVSANITQTCSIFFTNHVHKSVPQYALNLWEKFQRQGQLSADRVTESQHREQFVNMRFPVM